MKKNVLLALGSILGSSIGSQAAENYVQESNSTNDPANHEISEGIKIQKTFLLKVNMNNIENSMACFHTSHSSHSSHASHASHSSHSSSSFV